MLKITPARLCIAALIATPFVARYFLRRWKIRITLKTMKRERAPDKEYFLRIPSYGISSVIGKRGFMLRRIMDETGTDCKTVNLARSAKKVEDDWNEGVQPTYSFNDEGDDEKNQNNTSSIDYLVVKTNDPKKFNLVKLRVKEILENVKISWKRTDFLVESDSVGYIIGRGGKHIKNLSANFNVKIQISDPLTSDSSKAMVTVYGKDYKSIEAIETIIKQTTVPTSRMTPPKYDEELSPKRGIFQNIEDELAQLQKVRVQLLEDFR